MENMACPHDCKHCKFYHEYFDDGWDYVTKWYCDMNHTKKNNNCEDFAEPNWKDELGNFIDECGFGLFAFIVFILVIFLFNL